MILSEHVVRCDTDGKDFNTFWYQWTVGRLQQVFMAVRIEFISVLFLIHKIKDKFCIGFDSITSRLKSIAKLWKLYFSRKTWMPIF